MQIFIHNVGKQGADDDFPKTVFKEIGIDYIEKYLPEAEKNEIISTLWELFPDGACNVWGVPSGATNEINKLQIGDAVLLMRTISNDGEIPALAIVKAVWKEKMLGLSNALWGSNKFPYIFFFKTKRINLTWTEFKNHVGYSPDYKIPGWFTRIRPERLETFGDGGGYIETLIQDELNEDYTFESYVEGNKSQRFVTVYERDPKLKAKALEIHGYSCEGCNFNFEKVYGLYGKGFIHVHHLKPISEFGAAQPVDPETDLTVLCPNCHAMVHRYKNKTLSIEELQMLISTTSV